MILRTLVPLLVTAAISTTAMAGPIYLKFKSSYRTNEAIPEFSWEAGRSARGEAKVFLPDDTLLTTGSYEFHFTSYFGDWEYFYGNGVLDESNLPYGFARLTYPDFDDDTGLRLPGFADYTAEFPSSTLAYSGSFKILEDGTIRGGLGWGDWDDESLMFTPNFNDGYSEGHFYDGYMRTISFDNVPGVWLSAEVPEPGTLLLLTGALVGLALSRRRKQAS